MLLSWRGVLPALALCAAPLAGCAAAPAVSATPAPHVALALRATFSPRIASRVQPPGPSADAPASPPAVEGPPALPQPELPEVPAGTSLRLALGEARMPVPAGRSVVEVELQAGHYVSIVVLGRAEALLGFDVVGPPSLRPLRAHGPLDEDGLLPRALSFRAPEGADAIELLIDVEEPVEIARTSVKEPEEVAPRPAGEPAALLGATRPAALWGVGKPAIRGAGRAAPRPELPLIGLPVPSGQDDGYLLQAPGRYQFLRVDVARALLAALRQTRRRFRRDPIAIADISQWDGRRPASDLGAPRHISHEGGRDVDLALPATEGWTSTVQAHCDGVFTGPDVWVCIPGTARGVDSLRLAYFLGLLLDGPPAGTVTRIFTDEVYIRDIRQAIRTLQERRWIRQAGVEGLLDDRVLRASAWHTDHVHVRFGGPAAQPGL